MSQEHVRARDVAAPGDVTLKLSDALLICEKLDEALARESLPRQAWSEPARSLLQLAWAVASHKQSTFVTVYHLAYALLCSDPKAGAALAECLESDADAFAVGCILQILPLGVSTGDADILPPAVGTVRWLGQAIALARERGRRSEVLPLDIVRAVAEGHLDRPERRSLKKAARVGNARHVAVIGPKRLPAPTSAPEIIQHLEEVEKGRTEPGSDFANLVEMLEAFEERYSAGALDQKHALTRIEDEIGKHQASIATHRMPIDDVIRRLDTIDRRVSSLDEALPRPPTGARVAAAIVAVLTVGLVAGLAISYWQSGSRVAHAVAASVR